MPAHAYTQRHHRPEALGLYLCCRLPGDLYMQPCIFSLPRQVLLHCKELVAKFPEKKRYFSVASWELVVIANCFFKKRAHGAEHGRFKDTIHPLCVPQGPK